MKGLPRSMSRGTPSVQPIMKQVIKLNDVAIVVDGAIGVGFGSAVVGDLPVGNIRMLGAVCYAQFTKLTASTGITDTFDGDFAIGTTATADATITGTDGNIITSTALGAATAGVSPRVRAAHAQAATEAMLDNTDGSLELNLNLIIDDAAISADDQGLTVDGELHLSFIVLGDD